MALLGDLSLQTAGITFRHEGVEHVVYARLTNLVADGEGMKLALDTFAHGGLRPCIRCRNVLKRGSGLAHRRPGFVEITSEYARLQLSTTADINAEVDELCAAHAEVAAGTRTAASLRAMEQSFGIHANPLGLLADQDLRRCFAISEVICEERMGTNALKCPPSPMEAMRRCARSDSSL